MVDVLEQRPVMTRFQAERPILKAAAEQLCAELRGYNRLKGWARGK
jgi:hypothetical protein